MKSRWVVLTCAVLALTMLAGCTPEQIKAIAQQSGLASAVGWIAIDNPDKATIEVVKGTLAIIEEKSADVEGGATYTEVVYPEVAKYIDSDQVEARYRPAAKAAAISLLGGLDLLFASNPEWKDKQDLAIQVVDAFIVGAKTGLSLAEDDPRMVTARATAARRAKVYKAQ